MTSLYKIKGKNALVTGSSSGIGMGIAKELCRHGANVIIHYTSKKNEAMKLQKELGSNQCLGILYCDFRRQDTIPDFINQVYELCCNDNNNNNNSDSSSSSSSDHLDILINNAGIVTKLALEDDDNNLSSWHETMAINLHAPYLISKLVCTKMKEKKDCGGVIINVTSIHAEKSIEYLGAYAASKSALESLTRTMAIEFAPYNIRVNALAPGVVQVERTEQFFQDPKNLNVWIEKLPLGRIGTVDAIAHACIPLIENEWITGSIWQVDGGTMARSNLPIRPRPSAPPNKK